MSRNKVVDYYVIACMLVLSVVAYLCFTKPLPTRRPDVQTTLYSQVPAARPGPPPTATPVPNGDSLLYMEIPRFGKEWLWVSLEGIDLDTLAKGPGHYPNTELPGEEGNAAFAAHRATHGDPFIDFDLLENGDTITLSQSGAKWTYTIVKEPVIIGENAGWVLNDFAAGKWLTLTTCWPKYGSEKRMYIRAKLVS